MEAFGMSDSEEQRGLHLLGVFAHPDDEVFCIGGTMAKYLRAGAEAMVVSLTQGEAGQIRDANVATRRTLGKVRAEELHRSCEQLGVQNVVCLDYGDGKLNQVPRSVLVERITGCIREFRPDVVFTFDSTGAYGHPDHIVASEATTSAFWASSDPAAFPEQIADGLSLHAPERLYHSYFPQNKRMLLGLLSQWLESLDSKFRGTSEFIHGLMLFADESSMLGYVSDHIDVKWFPPGFYIIEQGEPSTALYLILSGHAEVHVEDEDGNISHVVTRGPGHFVGETGIAYGKARSAHVVASDNVTCLVFSPGEPTAFAGRGEEAGFATAEDGGEAEEANIATTCIDARDFVNQKMAAMAQHRTQYLVTPDMFPPAMSSELLGREYFVHISRSADMENDLLPAGRIL
jgi:LmbE family N-acetylglucosaminyl deacetylase